MAEENRAAERTKRRLRTAFAELLGEKDFLKISVNDITQKAEMSRATFYLHFRDIDDFSLYCKIYLMETVSRQLIHWLKQGRDNLDTTCKRKNLLISETDIKLLREYSIQKIYFSNRLDTVSNIFIEYFKECFNEEFVEQNKNKIEIFMRGYCINSLAVIRDYDYDKMKQELNYVFNIWNLLFPNDEL